MVKNMENSKYKTKVIILGLIVCLKILYPYYIIQNISMADAAPFLILHENSWDNITNFDNFYEILAIYGGIQKGIKYVHEPTGISSDMEECDLKLPNLPTKYIL